MSFPNNSLIYNHTETPLIVAAANYDCKSIVLKCPGAKIEMVQPCMFLFTAEKVGELTMDIFIAENNDTSLTTRQLIVVKERPIPEARVAGLKGGTIRKGNLKVQQGVGAHYYISGNHWENCTIESYHVVILRDNKIIFDQFNQGNIFNAEVKKSFETLTEGDKVYFLDISGCKDRENGGNLKSLEFTIDN